MTTVPSLHETLQAARDNASVIIQQVTGADPYRAGVARDLISLIITSPEGLTVGVGVGLVMLMLVGPDSDIEWAPHVNTIIAAVRECDSILADFAEDDF